MIPYSIFSVYDLTNIKEGIYKKTCSARELASTLTVNYYIRLWEPYGVEILIKNFGKTAGDIVHL